MGLSHYALKNRVLRQSFDFGKFLFMLVRRPFHQPPASALSASPKADLRSSDKSFGAMSPSPPTLTLGEVIYRKGGGSSLGVVFLSKLATLKGAHLKLPFARGAVSRGKS